MRNFLSFFAAVPLALAAGPGADWDIEPLVPFPVDTQASVWQTANLESLYQTGGGFAAAGRESDQPSATEPTQGAVAFRLEHASWGFGISELRADFEIGGYCTDFPYGNIDWSATQTAITNSAAYREGYLFYVDSATNDEERVIFTRGGEVTVPWVLEDGTAADLTYTVAQTSRKRPYRIFWTEYPFNGPKIDLSAHPHVRLLGDPSIVKPVYEGTSTSGTTGVSNIVKGVVFDSDANALRCYTRVIDEATRRFDGPEGQFVLAYYNSGTKDKLIATIVVEACAPDVSVINVSVGDELRPTGGGYDIEGLESRISKGDQATTGDKASPYLYKHAGKTGWSPKNNSVFAISPTDSTTTNTGEEAPWRADIYWLAPDPMDVLWPFEENWYCISWPEEAPRFVISGDDANPGMPLFVPTNYIASVCDYQSPANIASASNDGCVSASGEGWFTLKISDDDNVWFQPVKAVLRTDAECALTNAVDWTIGKEIALLGGSAAGNTAAAAAFADGSLPGYVYAPASGERRNWNPRLYRDPKQDSMGDSVSAPDSSADAYAGLVSAIYPVNTAPDPIEVWWQRKILQDGMVNPLRMPCVVQRYNPEWPRQKDVQNIVIASQLGSAGMIAGASASALYMKTRNDTAVPAERDALKPGLAGGLTFGMWINPSPHAAGNPEVTPGLVALMDSDLTPSAVAFRLETGDKTVKVKLVTTEDSGSSWTDVASVPIPTNEWTFVSLSLDPADGISRAANLRAGGEGVWSGTLQCAVLTNSFSLGAGSWRPRPDGIFHEAATGVALDGISVWSAALSTNQLEEIWQKTDGSPAADVALQCRYDFDSASDLVPVPGSETRTSLDDVGYRRLVSTGFLRMSPGAPGLMNGLVTSDGDVKPEIYRQNDSSLPGFNPNDEHAFLVEGNAGWTVHALRCDLASEEGSQPFVLVQYNDAGKGAMRVFGVQLTNDVYNALGSAREAGLMLTPPAPLSTLDSACNPMNFAVTVAGNAPTNGFGEITADSEVVYHDRLNRMWARRDGSTDAFYYYGMQEGFWLPGLSEQPAAGTLVPWLARIGDENADLLSGAPMAWRWEVKWPSDDRIPVMRVAQTLTKAVSGLPDVWNASSAAVVFPAPAEDRLARERVVHLIDPTVAQTQPLEVAASFPGEYAFTLGNTGTAHLKDGKYYFTGLPPSIADRFYVDAANQKMCLVGKYIEKDSGGSYLQLNVLSPEERNALLAICRATGDAQARWQAAVNALAVAEVRPNTVSRKAMSVPVRGATVQNIDTKYSPVDRYALVASGEGVGYVTIIENDNPDTSVVPEGSTISMHVIKVVPELYADGLTVITDPLNRLSEQLTVAYTAPFGAAADDFEFEWRRIETQTDGSVPTNYPDWRVYGSAAQAGRTAILLGAAGADLKDLQNMYYAMRYRAKSGSTAYSVTGETWSDWCGPTLAEGWVQRVLNSVTPFTQRCMDFSSYTSDISYSMLEQIGAPYRGDVALNNDNLNNIGLLELYKTVLNKAESMSLALGAKTDAGVNKQLLLAASRIAELYGILGDEAYADAKNPAVGERFKGTVYDPSGLSSSVFCFNNQLATLLDEELALLRGRTKSVAPNMTTYPYYNRLVWNFTKGVTEGEVAYVNNYMIYGSDGEITVEQAAKQYPQGHGDAYGHYLSMLKSFYHLVRNPYFDWYASMTEMLVGDSVVNVDYFDEEKFAEAAGNIARTALDTMDLTARKTWKETEGVTGGGYFDENPEQAFGYGEWAVRGGYATLCNWAVVNSLLPTNGTPVNAVFSDKGVSRIDRSTASSLSYLPAAVADIQRRLDALDSGLNPLGLSDDAIPFDLDATGNRGGTGLKTSHFEQILARTEKALGNTKTVLSYAQKYGSRLAQISIAESEAEESHEKTEAEYNKKLIAVYGTPIEGDIGPGGLYVQGYSGPDIYHYMYVDLKPYGLEAVESKLSKTIVDYSLETLGKVVSPDSLNYVGDDTIPVTYTLTPDGIPQASDISGTRKTEGSIQSAYRDFLAAYVKMRQSSEYYDYLVEVMKEQCVTAKAKLRYAAADLAIDEVLNGATIFKAGVDLATGRTLDALDMTASIIEDGQDLAIESTPDIIGAGLTVNTDPSAIVGGLVGAAAMGGKNAVMTGVYGAKTIAASTDFWMTSLSAALKGITDGFDYYDAQVDSWETLLKAVDDVGHEVCNLQNAYAALVAAEQKYRTKIAEGEALKAELAMVRKHWANTGTSIRYAEMYNRIQRNNALTKYSSAFDTAQRYVYMLARVYDYETGLLSSDPLAGDGFMRSVIAARSLGEKGVVTDGDATLWDAVTRMSANWDVLKARLGVNSSEVSTKWFSLRYSHFRINPGGSGDQAWRDTLGACWKDDIFADSEIARYCQPPQSDTAPVAAEPGLVIAFSTSINLAENFFGKPLLGGESTYSSSDYAVKIYGAGLKFEGYGNLALMSPQGLATEPNVYLVPVGRDYMRAPAGATRETLAFKVVDQVMPVPYDSSEISSLLQNENWISTLYSGDTSATIRRHSTMGVTVGSDITSRRLTGRSVWNDRWLIVIPASSLSSDRVNALKTFINGLDTDGDGQIDVPGVSDIKLGIKAYSRSGN